MREFRVNVTIKKGLGPSTFNKTMFVGLDDLPPEATEYEIKEMVKADINSQLANTEDYRHYGKNWVVENIEEI